MFNAACALEQAVVNECARQAEPVFTASRACQQQCRETRDRGLEGYVSACPNGHAGQRGTNYTFVNGNQSSRHVYLPNPYPTYADRFQNVTRFQQYSRTLEPGQQISIEVACGISFPVDFKDVRTDGSHHTGDRILLSGGQCCEQVRNVPVTQYDGD